MIQWNLTISEKTDKTVRDFLARKGAGDEQLSSFVDKAVRSEILRQTVKEVHSQNADENPEQIQALVDEAVDWARENRS